MTSNWDTLHSEEKKLLEKEENLTRGIKQTKKIKEAYDYHLSEAKNFMDDLHYTFHKNDKSYQYESIKMEISREARKIMMNLENDEQELTAQKRNVQQKMEDIYYEKKRVSLEEEEKKE